MQEWSREQIEAAIGEPLMVLNPLWWALNRRIGVRVLGRTWVDGRERSVDGRPAVGSSARTSTSRWVPLGSSMVGRGL
jgi:hypothetical protein